MRGHAYIARQPLPHLFLSFRVAGTSHINNISGDVPVKDIPVKFTTAVPLPDVMTAYNRYIKSKDGNAQNVKPSISNEQSDRPPVTGVMSCVTLSRLPLPPFPLLSISTSADDGGRLCKCEITMNHFKENTSEYIMCSTVQHQTVIRHLPHSGRTDTSLSCKACFSFFSSLFFFLQ